MRDNRAHFESVHVVNASVIAWGEDEATNMHVSQVQKRAGEAMEASERRLTPDPQT